MQHSDLAKGKWFTLTLGEQLGNVGSEYERTIRAKQVGDERRAQSALQRFLELIDLTLADKRWKGPRRREIARLREQSLAEFEGQADGAESLSRYYLYFATLARSNH